MADENKSIQELTAEVNVIDEIDQQCKNVEDSIMNPKPIDDLDVNVIDESLKETLTNSMKSENSTQENLQSLGEKSKEELQRIFIEKLRDMPVEERNTILKNLAELQQVNPKDRKFASFNDSYRETLKRKLRDKRRDLEWRRKPKVQILKMRQDHEEKMKQLVDENKLNENKLNENTDHVHDEHCNHDHHTVQDETKHVHDEHCYHDPHTVQDETKHVHDEHCNHESN